MTPKDAFAKAPPAEVEDLDEVFTVFAYTLRRSSEKLRKT